MGKSGGTMGHDEYLTKLYHRGHWRPNEDTNLRYLIDRYSVRNWNFISEELQGRSGKSCSLRWFNQLDPKINKKPFTKEEEEERLLSAHSVHGNKWSLIAKLFPGKTDNVVKNQQQLPPPHTPKNGSPGNSSSSRPSSWVFSGMNSSSPPTPSWTSSLSLWSSNTSFNNSKQEDGILVVPYSTLSPYGLPRLVPTEFSCLDAHASCSTQTDNQDNRQKEEDQYHDQDQDDKAFEG